MSALIAYPRTLIATMLAFAVTTTTIAGIAATPPQPPGTPQAVEELLRFLSRPHDQVKLAAGEVVDIEPVSADTLLDANFTGNVVTKTVADGGQPLVLTSAGVAQYLPFERLALERIADFDKGADELTPLQRLAALETALATTLRFSQGARERPLKDHNRWKALQEELDRKLLEVRLALLSERTKFTRTEKDLHFGEDLVGMYPGNAAVLTAAARQRIHYAYFMLMFRAPKSTANHYADIRGQLQWVDDYLPQPPFAKSAEAEALRQIFISKAAALWEQAKQNSDEKTATQQLRTAAQIWPHLPGLRDELLKRQGKYVILYVGVRALPTHFSPARAVTDAELQTLELLFEGMVRTQATADGAHAYVPQLATSLPRVADGTRHVVLKKTAYWSTGARVTADDVQKTFELFASPKLGGSAAEVSHQIESVQMEGDVFNLQVKLRKGLLDPLAPFTFKVLPRDYAGSPLAAADSEAFALAPVGSGPYKLAGKFQEQGRTYLRLEVNPYFVSRHGPDGPRIREIRLFVSSDPVADLTHKTAPAHLVLDVSANDLAKLKTAGIKHVNPPTRRVCFVAVNHRHGPLADPLLRRALAHALNRRQLVTDCFGSGKLLNGPFPAESWANCADERVPADLFDHASAVAFLKTAKNESYELELKYPNDDPRVAKACHDIKDQWTDLGEQAGRPINIRLIPLPPHQLHRDLQSRDYQLAYWRYDYPSDAYSLWPLFDAREQAVQTGANYLGYKDDDTWTELLFKASSHRDFAEVKRLNHDIHAAFHQRMPLIPLWQPEYAIAFHPGVTTPPLDPLRVFANIEEWQLAGH